MDRTEALAYLTQDPGRVPCSRYGSSSEECAPIAIALAEIIEEANGDEGVWEEESLDDLMGLVVNDHDDVSSLIRKHGTEEHRALIEDVLLNDLLGAEQCGTEAGKAAASWAFDGDTDRETYAKVLKGIEDGDPEIMDMQPAPLSGEWAGESIPELSARYGIDLEDEEIADRFEEAYSQAFWDEIERTARYHLTDDDNA